MIILLAIYLYIHILFHVLLLFPAMLSLVHVKLYNVRKLLD